MGDGGWAGRVSDCGWDGYHSNAPSGGIHFGQSGGHHTGEGQVASLLNKKISILVDEDEIRYGGGVAEAITTSMERPLLRVCETFVKRFKCFFSQGLLFYPYLIFRFLCSLSSASSTPIGIPFLAADKYGFCQLQPGRYHSKGATRLSPGHPSKLQGMLTTISATPLQRSLLPHLSFCRHFSEGVFSGRQAPSRGVAGRGGLPHR